MNNKKEIIEESLCEVDQYGNKLWYTKGMLYRENDLPAVEWLNGDKWWYLNGKLNRENDKPAIEYANGTKRWYLNSKFHREKSPAVEYANGTKEWWWYGERVEVNSQEEFEEKLPYLIMKDFHKQ